MSDFDKINLDFITEEMALQIISEVGIMNRDFLAKCKITNEEYYANSRFLVSCRSTIMHSKNANIPSLEATIEGLIKQRKTIKEKGVKQLLAVTALTLIYRLRILEYDGHGE